jgi:hypothetical protein
VDGRGRGAWVGRGGGDDGGVGRDDGLGAEVDSELQATQGRLRRLKELLDRLRRNRPKPPKDQSLDELFKPGGKDLGTRRGGADEKTRTVTADEFDHLAKNLRDGSRQLPCRQDYEGELIQRQDGSIIEFRKSEKHGPTIDVFDGLGKIPNGYKVHRQ